ncbi:polysaccharide biosynthesis PFTS motif protein [Methanoregula formicica]|uniref:Uncharacterized protein n=1 Tax=Methanoregula formicica (strain DSM 22288 / NBRC 105244 / SMSP) TaxID=593750 RepID=L0HGZ4_METFS|nr:polysaccharide biosynthesis PFTS motif protein [Methanoregula formicica]AGB02344.1 hypothetical protein Metfor_1302 [Methanoregula formicica SMSP]
MTNNPCTKFQDDDIYEVFECPEFSTFKYNFIEQYAQHNCVLADIDMVFREKFEGDAFLSTVESLTGSSLIRGAYKKAMCHIMFINYRNRHFNVPVHRESKLKSAWKYVRAVAQFAVYPLWIVYKIGIPSLHKKPKQTYQCGFRVSCCDWSFRNKCRSFDFLIDKNLLSKENVIFCIEEPISSEYRAAIDERGYDSVQIREILKNADISFLYREFLKKQFPAWLKLLIRSPLKPPYMLSLTLEILYKSLLWSKFFEDYHVGHYVVFNDDLPADIIRYIHADRSHTRTWFYIHSCSTNDFLTPPGMDDVLDTLYAFYATHHLVVWGRKMENYYRKHPHFIQCFDRFGCLFSEQVREARERPDTNTPRQKLLMKCHPKKIIGVFDTSFTETCPLGFEDMIRFVSGLLQLLEDFPDIGIIFKNKNSLKLLSEYVPQILPHYQKLQDHPRVYFTDADNTDPTECLAAADLVISAPFTSSSIEAIGAKIPALYYDASNRFPGCYYDRIPRFVAHNYAELKDFVNYWLIFCPPAEFEVYLNSYFKGELHEDFDAKAISRLREQLAS